MTFEYPALFTCQRPDSQSRLTCALFTAPVGEVLQWAAVDRLTFEGSGHQRLKNEAKLRAIKRFLELDERNTIPTALTIALHLPDFDGLVPGSGTLQIPAGDPKPGLVIDGQHRMFGMNDFDSAMPVNIVGLINPGDDEVAFQFLVINNKVTKVPTDHLKLLSLQYDQGALADRLRSARMVLGRQASLVGVVDRAEDSPFYRSVLWPAEPTAADGERQGLVLPAAVEQALAAIAQKNLPDLEDDDALLEFFFTLWRVVSDVWPELWVRDSKLLSKVGVVTLTTFIIDDLTPLADRGTIDLADPTVVETEIRAILADLVPEFWTVEWQSKSLDTSAGRNLVVEALVQIRRNQRRGVPWAADVQLVAGSAQ